MDRREIKTKQSIKEAFLELRATKNLERITVKELVARANISKATFYLHYHDIYDLSDQLEQEIIEGILNDLKDPEEIIKNSASFTRKYANAFLSRKELIDIVFSGSKAYILPDQIDKSLRSYIFQKQPELKNDPHFRIRLSYRIKGGYYAFHDNVDHINHQDLIEEIGKISEVF